MREIRVRNVPTLARIQPARSTTAARSTTPGSCVPRASLSRGTMRAIDSRYAPSARIDALLLGCTHYPLLRAAIAAVAGEGIAIVDSAAATASALAELLSINGLEAPASTTATHLQLTTGDVDAFRSIAERMFGEAFPDVVGVELGRAASTAGAAPI